MPEAWRFVFLDPATSGNCRCYGGARHLGHPDTVERSVPPNGKRATPMRSRKLNGDGFGSGACQVREAAKLKASSPLNIAEPARSGQEPFWTSISMRRLRTSGSFQVGQDRHGQNSHQRVRRDPKLFRVELEGCERHTRVAGDGTS